MKHSLLAALLLAFCWDFAASATSTDDSIEPSLQSEFCYYYEFKAYAGERQIMEASDVVLDAFSTSMHGSTGLSPIMVDGKQFFPRADYHLWIVPPAMPGGFEAIDPVGDVTDTMVAQHRKHQAEQADVIDVGNLEFHFYSEICDRVEIQVWRARVSTLSMESEDMGTFQILRYRFDPENPAWQHTASYSGHHDASASWE